MIKTNYKRGIQLRQISYLVTGILLCSSSSVIAQEFSDNCGSLDNRYGPYDYSNPIHTAKYLDIVDSKHFTREVQQMLGRSECGGNRCGLADDLDYTLRAFPNHYPALLAVMEYYRRGFDELEKPMRYTQRCYFVRALRFKPDDFTVRMVFGQFLYKSGKPDASLEQYQKAVELAPTSSEAHYNLGLMYADRKEYLLARDHAKKAYALGFPLPGLRAKLQRAGQWDQPEQIVPDENE